MTILEAMQKTIDEAKSSGRICYLYERRLGYYLSPKCWNDWIFQAHPGGRKILSEKGDELVKEAIRSSNDEK